jgi:hypothetical protein
VNFVALATKSGVVSALLAVTYDVARFAAVAASRRAHAAI